MKRRKRPAKFISYICVLCMVGFYMVAIVSCGSGDHSSNKKDGIFVDSPVEGLEYKTLTQSGITDVEGTFKYREGETITFSIGDITIGQAPGIDFMSPIDIVDGAVDVINPTVTNICRFLLSLDVDGAWDNGIAISEEIRNECAGRSINFSQSTTDFGNDPSVQTLFNKLNDLGVFTDYNERILCSPKEAQKHLEDSLSGNGRVDEDVIDQATLIACGDTLTHLSIHTIEDKDWYTFKIQQQQSTQINLLNPGGLRTWVYDSSLSLIASEDGNSPNIKVDMPCLPLGAYYVLVESSRQLTGYEIGLSCLEGICDVQCDADSYEPNDTEDSATIIAKGEKQKHSLCPSGDVDRFVFDLSLPDPGPKPGPEWGELFTCIHIHTSIESYQGLQISVYDPKGGSGYSSQGYINECRAIHPQEVAGLWQAEIGAPLGVEAIEEYTVTLDFTTFWVPPSTDETDATTDTAEIPDETDEIDETNSLLSGENSILTFSLQEQLGPVIIDEDKHTVSIEVSLSADISLLTPTITISSKALITPLSGEPVDFSSGSASYVVTAEDGTQQTWNVIINSINVDETSLYFWDIAKSLGIKGSNVSISFDALGSAFIVANRSTSISAMQYSFEKGWGDTHSISNPDAGAIDERVQAFDNHGNFFLLWVERSDSVGKKDLWAKRYDANKGWSENTLIEFISNENSAGLKFVVDSQGNGTALWRNEPWADPYNLWINDYNYNNEIWSHPTLVEDLEYYVDSYSIVVNAKDVFCFIYDQGNQIWYNTFSISEGLGNPQRIDMNTTGENINTPRLFIDADNNAVAIWNQNWKLWYSEYESGQGWTGAKQAEHGGAIINTASGKNGHLIVVWGSASDLWAIEYRRDTGWDAIQQVDISDGRVENPIIKFDLKGNAIIMWEQSNDEISGWDIWARRLDKEKGWNIPEIVWHRYTPQGSAENSFPNLSFDPYGNAFAFWTDPRGEFADVPYNAWMVRYSIDSGWETPELIDNSDIAAYGPVISTDYLGRAIMAWVTHKGIKAKVFK